MAKYTNIQSGVALLMTLGILALLSILGVAFSTSMRVMERTTRDFVYEMQARYLAEGGIEYAVAKLKEDARNNFVWNNNVAVENKYDLLGGIGSIENVEIKDCASKININYASKELLDTVIKWVGPKFSEDIVEQRNGPDGKPGRADHDDDSDGVTDEADELGAEESDDSPFLTPKSIGIVRDVYKNNKDIMTTWGYCDPNTQDSAGNNSPRSAINVHTADSELIKLLAKAINGVSVSEAKVFASEIDGKEFHSWKEFKDEIETLDDAEKLMNNFNPNKHKPGWDRNAASTEICFHSSGIYEVSATGTITKDNQIFARKTINTTVKIFDLWNQTTKEQFKKPDYGEHGWKDLDGETGGNDGEIGRVTWFDSCPIREDQNWNQDPENFDRINDSLKLGFWDSFENKYEDEIEYSKLEWKTKQAQTDWNTSNIPESYYTGHSLAIPSPWVEIYLSSQTRWDFDNMLGIVYLNDIQEPQPDSEWNEGEVPSFVFRYLDKDDDNAYGGKGGGDDSVQLSKYKTDVNPDIEEPHYRVSLKSEWDGHWILTANYAKEKLYRVHQVSETVTIYMNTNLSTTGFGFPICDPIIYAGNRQNNKGRIKFWGGRGGVIIDNIRVIPENGYYICEPFITPDSEIVEWGTIWGTETLPKRNDGNYDAGSDAEDTNEIAFQTRTCTNQNWGSVDYSWRPHAPNGDGGDFNVDSMKQPESGNGIERINGIGNILQYRAAFVTDGSYQHTPVLEDVWITYLPKTKILYWKEGAEE